MKNVITFDSFLNEAKDDSKNQFELTKQVQDSIKEMCEGVIHENAMAFNENDNKDQTYEMYTEKCSSYMNERMCEAMEVYRASAKTTAGKY